MDRPNSGSTMLANGENGWHQDSLSVELLVNRIEDKDSIINGISDAIMLLDSRTYKILEVNEAFLKSYGVDPGDVIGKTCYEITHHLSEPCPESSGEPCPLRETVLKGKPCHTEHLHKDREGNNLYFEISSYPLRDFSGDITRIVHLSRDITERRLAEEALKEKVTRSEHLAALGQLVSEITHEIKNPLMMVGGLARQLMDAEDEEIKSKKLAIITEEVARLENLLADLREYYLPKPPACEPVNVKEVLEKLCLLVKEECLKKDIQIEFIMEQADLVVSWDPRKMEQVFLNVIKNAVEAMENGGSLIVKAKIRADKVEITISDDGCGIPRRHMDKILDCFFTTKSQGTGLGLCVSKKYIDEHQGSSFSVKSEDGKGTTVKISIPASEVLVT